jgi:hypothetical protein
MTTTRTIATAAVVTLLTGLGAAVTATTSHAQTTQTTQAAAKAARYEVTATVSDTEPVQGDTITFRGSVTPGKAGAVVVLQKRYGTTAGWKRAGTDTLNRSGRFTFHDQVGGLRWRQYRVIKHGDRTRRAGWSTKLGVTVYGWRDLTSLTPAGAATGETDSVVINGVSYPQSLIGSGSGNAGTLIYEVKRDCKRFEGQVGLSDTSAPTSTGHISLRRRTTTLYANSFGLTESEPVVLDLTGVHKLTLDWTSTNTEGTPEDQSGAVIAVGSPRILCKT